MSTVNNLPLNLHTLFSLEEVGHADLRPLLGIPEDSGYSITLSEEGHIEQVCWWENDQLVTKSFDAGAAPTLQQA